VSAQAPGGSPSAASASPTPAVSLPDFASLVERFGKAVVNVEVTGRARVTASSGFPSPEEDPFYDFFRRFGIPAPDPRSQREAPLVRGAGSGFIVSPDGYILTYAHVVENADDVRVRLTDRREFTAKVIGSDRRTDVAVIKIDAKDLPVVRIGDRAKLRPGEWVLAIGSPFGLENSATAGIVSATSRAVGGESNVPFIQTDVAVNPGNSGGPLFNLRGEVVGINSMIFSRTGMKICASPRWMRSAATPASRILSISARKSWGLRMGRELTASTMSPGCTPAWAAGPVAPTTLTPASTPAASFSSEVRGSTASPSRPRS
jgi:serine protease Do